MRREIHFDPPELSKFILGGLTSVDCKHSSKSDVLDILNKSAYKFLSKLNDVLPESVKLHLADLHSFDVHVELRDYYKRKLIRDGSKLAYINSSGAIVESVDIPEGLL